MTAHSKRGASSAHRWWNCPGSVRECEKYKDRESVFAAEGSAAHALGERCLVLGRDAGEFIGQFAHKTGLFEAPGEMRFEVTQEMADAVQVYLDAARQLIEPGDEWDVEQRLHLTQIHESMFGTADLVVFKPETKRLYVVDYKHGRGLPVEVEANPQLLYYALGAALRHHNRGLSKVTVVVVQPRCSHRDGPIRQWTIDAVDLLEWSTDLRAAVERTFNPSAPLVPGHWCKSSFCSHAPNCEALRNKAIETARADFDAEGELLVTDPLTYDPQKLAKTLEEVDVIEDWCRRVREFAHHEAEAGRVPPGYKLVPTRPSRVWKDMHALKTDLQKRHGVLPTDFYQDPKDNSPAQMEAVLRKKYGLKGEKATKAIRDYYDSVSKGTVLAPLADEREPVKTEAAKDFEK